MDRERVRASISKSFTPYHARLLDLCVGAGAPGGPVDRLNDYVDPSDLRKMKGMVEMEMVSSLEKNRKGTEETGKKSEPHVFDVYLMEATLERGSSSLAVCVPIKRKLLWYDGETRVWHMDPPQHLWRVASLSGSARVLEALDNPTALMRLAMERKGLVDVEENIDELMEVNAELVADLNLSQRRAVATVASAKFQSGFFALQGPPGCGKTTTLVAMISAIGSQVVVTAPSNAAVANVAIKLYGTGRYHLHEIAVHGENGDPSVDFLNPRKRGEAFGKFRDRYDKTTSSAEKDKLRADFLQWLHQPSDLELIEIARLCPFIDMDSDGGRKFYRQYISNASVVFSTLNSAGSPMLRDSVSAGTLLLDEAAQCTEAEFYIATNFPGIERIIVMGDPKQLPSTVVDVRCESAGFGSSWLSKILKLKPSKVHLLDTQYRMHPLILEFPNREFYRGRIRTGDNVLDRTLKPHRPFLFVDTSHRGREELADNTFSWLNMYEATVIRAMLFSDPDVQMVVQNLERPRVIVISPYRAQMELIKSMAKLGGKIDFEVATVDSYQGQEADVVILATIRTMKPGFVDNAQRLNVGLTRARYVLRVVGDGSFFSRLGGRSTLRKLAAFGLESMSTERTTIQRVPWSCPNWSEKMVWKTCMTQRFINCLREMTERNQNNCLNTLHAVALPDEHALYAKVPEKGQPSGYRSSLKGYMDNQIVWIAKEIDVPTIEAHFAGIERECLRFLQMYHAAPPDARIVKKGLCGLEPGPIKKQDQIQDDALVLSWKITNTMQRAVRSGKELPIGSIQLDASQEEVARAVPPTIIQSRSGTGKTNVLLQHAVYHAAYDDTSRASCFVTVSPRLRNELEQRYDSINKVENHSLPPTLFFSFSSLLEQLLVRLSIQDFVGHQKCTYPGFVASRKSYERLRIESHLVEGEIGGVILGSLTAATQAAPLSRESYLAEIRSNVESGTALSHQVRGYIYDEFERYAGWKRECSAYDIGDVVLRLIREDIGQLFAAAYLDEIQDLSYAAVYLLCSIAGKDSLRWVCAGDPAQMISPGCSFTFDGLKQTLLAVRPGIEARLSQVTQLLVNYRTTKDVLLLGNEILKMAKLHFPLAIPFAKPEVAKKDLGLKVVLAHWNEAFQQKVQLGTNQALIYSSDVPEDFVVRAEKWIGMHPFIISALDSKGLEFDDVIVGFEKDRKVWDIGGRSQASLRLMRELYVAVSRAKRRLVILCKQRQPEMHAFFASLGIDFEKDGVLVLTEFHSVISAGDWMTRAIEFVENEDFHMAASCFKIAGNLPEYHWASAKHCVRTGEAGTAAEHFFEALRLFFQSGQYVRVLDVCLELAQPATARSLKWEPEDSEVVEESIRRKPGYLRKDDHIRLALLRDNWDRIQVEDVLDESLVTHFIPYRGHPMLDSKIADASAAERSRIEHLLPLAVADYYSKRRHFDEATRLYLSTEAISDAVKSTKEAVEDVERGLRQQSLLRAIGHWHDCGNNGRVQCIQALQSLFDSPLEAAESRGKDCLRLFGRQTVLLAVETCHEDRLVLHDFDSIGFRAEVTEELVNRHVDNKFEVVRWFLRANDRAAAEDFVEQQRSVWQLCELDEVFHDQADWPAWLFEELRRRKVTPEKMLDRLSSPDFKMEFKKRFIDSFIEFDKSFEGDKYCIMRIVTCFVDQLSPREKRPRKKDKKKKMRDQRTNGSGVPTKEGDPAVRFVERISHVWPLWYTSLGRKPKNAVYSCNFFTEEKCKGLLVTTLQSLPGPDRCKVIGEMASQHVGDSMPALILQQALNFSEFDIAINFSRDSLSPKLPASAANQVVNAWMTKVWDPRAIEYPHSTLLVAFGPKLLADLRLFDYHKLVNVHRELVSSLHFCRARGS